MSEAAIKVSAYQSGFAARPAGFGQLLRAEWTKFRTVRGWLAGMLIAALATVGIALLDHSSCGGTVTPGGAVIVGQGCSSPVGPGGEAVTDSPYFVHQPLGTDGSITVRVTSLTGQSAGPGEAGLQPWSKAGIMIKASDQPGSAYAAMMVTAGHGVRMQYDFTGDVAGRPGPVSAASPRWLRLTRSGDTVTGYESDDGTRWHVVGTVRLASLPPNALAGLFAAAPAGSGSTTSSSISGSSENSGMNLATARFDHVSLRGGQPGQAWTGTDVGGKAGAPAGTGFHQAGGTFAVTGSGDMAPDVPAAPDGGGGFPIEHTLLGIFGGLVAVIVVAAMFMTAEYRRGLIRVTLAASPRRGRVLAAKAVVIGSVSFLAGLAGSTAALLAGEHLLRSRGNFIMPVSTLTEVRVVAGTAGLAAVTALLTLAIGTLLRSSAAAVTIVIAVVVLPYLLESTVLPAGAADWVLRITPAAGFAIQQSLPQYPQVAASYTPANGYFPLAPWAGFAVLCGYAALALALALIALRRRDA
jgi:ABC-type transport system involved in multi-copper enzyme maturation permease subunit